jgi:protein N-terminal methyltransferase
MIWIQWVVGHLHDKDFVDFFRNCSRGLTQNGVIILKDNCCDDWTFVVDKNDSSISRAPAYMKVLFDMANCKILLAAQQTDFPPELSSVYMFALIPNE